MTATAQPAASTSPYLSGIWEPVQQEMDSVDLEVTGTLPAHLDGRYLRNGPNPAAEVDPATYHLFSGDAMVHGLSLREGKAQWYRNRWVRTPSVSKALGETRPAAISANAGMGVIGPNTNVLSHAGRTLALVEGDRQLRTHRRPRHHRNLRFRWHPPRWVHCPPAHRSRHR